MRALLCKFMRNYLMSIVVVFSYIILLFVIIFSLYRQARAARPTTNCPWTIFTIQIVNVASSPACLQLFIAHKQISILIYVNI